MTNAEKRRNNPPRGGRRVRRSFGVFFLVLIAIETGLLIAFALTPGEKSAEQSAILGEEIDRIFTEMSGDEAEHIPPKEIEIVSDGAPLSEMQLTVGETAALGVSFLPAQPSVHYRMLEWSSTDETVCRAAGGTLTGTGAGDAVVTACVAGAPNIFATVAVHVSERFADLLRLTFADGTKHGEFETGEKIVLSSTLSPLPSTGEIVCTVSDPSVAEIEGNVLRTLHAGKAEVTVRYTARDGEKTIELSDMVSLSVTGEDAVLPERIALGFPPGQTFLLTGTRGSIGAHLYPEHAADLAVYTSSDPSVLSIDPVTGEFCALRKGKATLFAKAPNGVSASVEIFVTNGSLGAAVDIEGQTAESGKTVRLTAKAGSLLKTTVEANVPVYVRWQTSDPSVAEADGSAIYLYSACSEVVLVATVSDDPDFAGNGISEQIVIRIAVEKQPFSSGVSNWKLLIRKLFGHFGAFLVLGALSALAAICFDNAGKKTRIVLFAVFLVYGFFVAGLTEFFQLGIFTAGRGASFRDVLIDFGGFSCGYLPLMAVFGAVLLLRAGYRALKKKKRPKA